MKIIEHEQRSKEWLEWRRSGLGASDIASILEVSPFKTALKVYDEKSGLFSENIENEAISRGNFYEGEARQQVIKKLQKEFKPMCVQHDKFSWVIASLDGFNEEDNSILEIKVPNRKTLESVKDDIIPEHYEIQLYWQMFVTGAKKAYFAAYSPEANELYIAERYPNENYMMNLFKKAEKFWDNFLIGIPPKLQKGDFLEIRDERLKPIAERYKECSLKKKMIENEMKELREPILDFGDDGNFRGFGIKAIRMAARKSYDLKKMQEDGFPIENYVKNGTSSYYRIDIE